MILTIVPCIMMYHDLDKGTMVNHDLARLTMIMANYPWLRTLGREMDSEEGGENNEENKPGQVYDNS